MTRSLGVRYLWIDSLCILQKTEEGNDVEHKEDWERESQNMGKVFSAAYFTIAASCANHRFDGFLKERSPRAFVTFAAKDGATFHACDIIDNFDYDVEQGPLNKRGWVLQERALSRRTIHFTETQTYWECGEGIRCETFTRTENRKSAFLGDSDFPQSVGAFKQGKQIQHYQGLYERYSTLGLTNNVDRPVAIAGLEKRLLSALKSPGGYGVFHLEFHRDLLWQRQHQSPTAKRIKFEKTRQVPSWSWMSFDGHISYMNVPLRGIEWDTYVVSPFRGGSAIANAEKDFAAQHPREFKAPIFNLLEGTPSLLRPDDPERQLDRQLKCAVIARDPVAANKTRQIYAIIVTSIGKEGKTEVFERVGAAYLNGIEFENGDCERGFEIGIIR
ncbi:hypothetical protein CGCVW01_v011038 [Colletotrichum viniferum]|nr:hypothetical protein CGCVW01_v011038 [Colletotrichum viniferum]